MNDQGTNTPGDTKATAPAFLFDFFIAHASADKEHARRFADRLEPEFRVFLDTEDVPLGVDWGNVIDEAQKHSHFTLALISDKTEAAPYAMDEIRAAIDRERHGGGVQRLIPLYINGLPATADDYVYGLRTRQGLSLKEPAEYEDAVQRVRELMTSPIPSPMATLPPPQQRASSAIPSSPTPQQPPPPSTQVAPPPLTPATRRSTSTGKFFIAGVAVALLAVVGGLVALSRSGGKAVGGESSVSTAAVSTTGQAGATATTEPSNAATETTFSATAPLTMPVNKTVLYGGFEINLDSAVYTRDPQLPRGGDVVVSANIVNLTDQSLNFGYLDVALDTKDETTNVDLDSKSVPGGGRAKVTMTAIVSDFDPNDAVLVFGRPSNNQSFAPLGDGPADSAQISDLKISGTAKTPGGLSATILRATLSPFPLVGDGTGAAQQAAAHEQYLRLDLQLAYSGSVNNTIFNEALMRPDGLTIGLYRAGNFAIMNPGEQSNSYVEFVVPEPSTGSYVFRFTSGSRTDQAEIAFTIS
jgi:TIR domain